MAIKDLQFNLLDEESVIKLIKKKIIDLFGRPAWELAKHGFQHWFDIADGRSREEKRNEANGYIDS